MTNIEAVRSISALIRTLERDIQLANSISSPNPEDDLVVKAAIVGFSYTSSTDQWEHKHFIYLERYLSIVCPGANDPQHRDYSCVLFFALSIGYVLGSYEKGEIGEDQVLILEKQIPGIALLYLNDILAVRI